MALTIKEGDLFDCIRRDQLDAIGHGVNCKGVMGAGIATEFKRIWPEMFDTYKDLCEKGVKPGACLAWKDDHTGLVIYNCFTQNLPGSNASYYAVTQSVHGMLSDAVDRGLSRIGIPRIASGIGGLDQRTVEGCLRVLSWTTPVELIIYDLPEAKKP